MAIQSITANQATVKTASVDVRVLTISGKQVTLAVFRQLIEEPLVDTCDGTLAGVPWGKVMYCPGKACSLHDRSPGHLHVVWQKGDQLRRAAVPEWWPDHHECNCMAENYLRAVILLRLAEWGSAHPQAGEFAAYREEGVVCWPDGLWRPGDETWSPRPVVIGGRNGNGGWSEWELVERATREPLPGEWPDEWQEEAAASLRDKARCLSNTDALARASELYVQSERDFAAGWEAWRKAFATLDALDQLFIAV